MKWFLMITFLLVGCDSLNKESMTTAQIRSANQTPPRSGVSSVPVVECREVEEARMNIRLVFQGKQAIQAFVVKADDVEYIVFQAGHWEQTRTNKDVWKVDRIQVMVHRRIAVCPDCLKRGLWKSPDIPKFGPDGKPFAVPKLRSNGPS